MTAASRAAMSGLSATDYLPATEYRKALPYAY
jgi:hypothetical protein